MHPILLKVGPFTLPTYGVILAFAWLAGARWLLAHRDEMKMSEDEIWRMIYWIFGGAFVGGKLLYFLVTPGSLRWSFDTLQFGFVYYGGFLGVAVSHWWFCRRNGYSFVKLADYCAAANALGHGIGRFACLAAGCCYGRHTDLPWGVALAGDPSRHPTQVYEAILNLLLFAALARGALPRVRDGRWRPGSVLFAYMLGYAVLRFLLEFARGDSRGVFIAGLSPSQWVAAVIAAGTLAVVIVRRRKN